MSLRLEDALIQMLIEAGTTGIKQSILTNKLQRFGTADEIKQQLEHLKDQNKVQKFIVKSKVSRPITWWRATEEIIK